MHDRSSMVSVKDVGQVLTTLADSVSVSDLTHPFSMKRIWRHFGFFLNGRQEGHENRLHLHGDVIF